MNAGTDVTLTGGAVVATTRAGAALWYNPAGIARIEKASLEITGVTLAIQLFKVPGRLTLESGEKSAGKTVNFSVIPEAITFTLRPESKLKLGVGLFNSSIRRTFVTEQVESKPGTSPTTAAVGGQNTRLDFFHISVGPAGEFGAKQRILLGGGLRFGRCDEPTRSHVWGVLRRR